MLSKVKSAISGRAHVTLLFEGIDSNGRTSSIYNASLKDLPNATFNDTISHRDYAKKHNLVFGGRGGFRSMYFHIYKACVGLVFGVTDIDNPVSLEEQAEQLQGRLGSSHFAGKPLLLLVQRSKSANKETDATIRDVAEIENELELTEKLQLEKITNRPWKMFFVDSFDKKSNDTQEAFSWLSERIGDFITAQKAGKDQQNDLTEKKSATDVLADVEPKIKQVPRKQLAKPIVNSTPTPTQTQS